MSVARAVSFPGKHALKTLGNAILKRTPYVAEHGSDVRQETEKMGRSLGMYVSEVTVVAARVSVGCIRLDNRDTLVWKVRH
jgi:hypothetical protein